MSTSVLGNGLFIDGKRGLLAHLANDQLSLGRWTDFPMATLSGELAHGLFTAIRGNNLPALLQADVPRRLEPLFPTALWLHAAAVCDRARFG